MELGLEMSLELGLELGLEFGLGVGLKLGLELFPESGSLWVLGPSSSDLEGLGCSTGCDSIIPWDVINSMDVIPWDVIP